jgi:hypothetical protein
MKRKIYCLLSAYYFASLSSSLYTRLIKARPSPSSFQINQDNSALKQLTGCDGCDRSVATETTWSVATAATIAMLSFATAK